jgi:hypothetical protein
LGRFRDLKGVSQWCRWRGRFNPDDASRVEYASQSLSFVWSAWDLEGVILWCRWCGRFDPADASRGRLTPSRSQADQTNERDWLAYSTLLVLSGLKRPRQRHHWLTPLRSRNLPKKRRDLSFFFLFLFSPTRPNKLASTCRPTYYFLCVLTIVTRYVWLFIF